MPLVLSVRVRITCIWNKLWLSSIVKVSLVMLVVVEHACIPVFLIFVIARLTPVAVALSALVSVVRPILRVKRARLIPLLLPEMFLLFLKFAIKWLSATVWPLIDMLRALVKLLVPLERFTFQWVEPVEILATIIVRIVILALLCKHCKVQLFLRIKLAI